RQPRPGPDDRDQRRPRRRAHGEEPGLLRPVRARPDRRDHAKRGRRGDLGGTSGRAGAGGTRPDQAAGRVPGARRRGDRAALSARDPELRHSCRRRLPPLLPPPPRARKRRAGLPTRLVHQCTSGDRPLPRPDRRRGSGANVGSRPMARPEASVTERPAGNVPDRNLALELARVTEAAALAAGRWIGRGDKEAADQAAVDGMRAMLDTVSMAGVVVIGEGEKDKAPMLYNGEEVGDGHGPEVDVAVDPLEGTRLTAKGQPNAIAVIAVAERGTMFFPGAAVYMDKIAAGPEGIEVVDIDAPPQENVGRVARAKGVKPSEISVVVLERDRHDDLIAEPRQLGAK